MSDTHKASPIIRAIVVEVVGAKPIEHASAELGIIKLIFEALIKSLSGLMKFYYRNCIFICKI